MIRSIHAANKYGRALALYHSAMATIDLTHDLKRE